MSAITPVPATRDDLYAFRISGEVGRDDMAAMARRMNDAFGRHDSVDMLLIFDDFDGRSTGAGLDPEVLKAEFRSLSNVNRYVVVGAPAAARGFLEAMGRLIPVEARTYDRGDVEKAWADLGARPA